MAAKHLMISALIFSLLGCHLVTDSSVNSKTTKDQMAASISREGLSYLSRAKAIQATIKFYRALELDPNSDQVKAGLATSLIQSEQLEEAEKVISTLKYQDGIPARSLRSQIKAASSNYETRIVGARELTALGMEILKNSALFKDRPDFSADRSAAALFGQSYQVYLNAGLYNEAICSLILAQGIAPSPDKSGKIFMLLVTLGRLKEAKELANTSYFKSTRELVSAGQVLEGIEKKIAAPSEPIELKESAFADVENESIRALRKMLLLEWKYPETLSIPIPN